jgi:hypothetical protein
MRSRSGAERAASGLAAVAAWRRRRGESMTNQATGSALRVAPDEAVGPYIRLPYSQLDELKRVLDSHGISYSVRENIISLEGGPYMAVVNLKRGTDAKAVQALLDGVR